MSYIGQVTNWNQQLGYGFVTVSERASVFERPHQKQYFLHYSNFTANENPIIGAYIVFTIGPGRTPDKPKQCIEARFAETTEISAHLKSLGVSVGAAALSGVV
jgi:cold shock CspA family protein